TQVNVQSSHWTKVKDGIDRLLEVEEQNRDRANFGFEKSWIAHSLLSGYRRLGTTPGRSRSETRSQASSLYEERCSVTPVNHQLIAQLRRCYPLDDKTTISGSTLATFRWARTLRSFNSYFLPI